MVHQAANDDNDDDDEKKLQQVVAAATVGTRYILNSAHVLEPPPHVNRPVPVPSMYHDERGEIHNLLVDTTHKEIDGRLPAFVKSKQKHEKGKRINVLYSKAGVMRSGDLHRNVQHDFVFEGQVCVWILQADGSTKKTTYTDYEYIAIPPYTPHIFEFISDTTMAEWWDGPFHSWYYEPYRAIVQASFPTSNSKGSFSLYQVVPRDESAASNNKLQEALSTFRKDQVLWTGLAIGITLGFMFGRRR